jgi:hypothetical protein
MPCLVKRSDNTVAYISKSNSVHLITHEHTPRPKPVPKPKLSEKNAADIQEIYDKINNNSNLTELQKQHLHRKIEKIINIS